MTKFVLKTFAQYCSVMSCVSNKLDRGNVPFFFYQTIKKIQKGILPLKYRL